MVGFRDGDPYNNLYDKHSFSDLYAKFVIFTSRLPEAPAREGTWFSALLEVLLRQS